MKRFADLESFRRSPNGGFVAGAGWIHFCAHPGLWGVVLFDRPDRDAATQMTRSFAIQTAAGAARHCALVDARHLANIDPAAFQVLEAYARGSLDRTLQKVICLALVPPAGMQGAVVAGFYQLLGKPLAIQLFETPREALAWLGEPPALAAALDDAMAEVRNAPPLLSALRSQLRANLTAPDPAGICRTLGLSQRSLQRRLQNAGTSFSAELLAARLAEAQHRLLDSEDAVTAVALDVGFASSQHFSRHFRRATGEAPSVWRRRRRK